MISAASLLAVAGSAFGSRAAPVGTGRNALAAEGQKGCVMKHSGVKSLIQPENSGLSCSSLRAVLAVLSDGSGVQTVENGDSQSSWVCRVYPKSALPREVRCHEGKRHFERVRIEESTKA